MNNYLNSVVQILRHGQNANSYKFALLRSLVQIVSRDPKSNTIVARELAKQFLALYWPLEVTYRIRQGTDPDKDPVVMSAIRNLMQIGKIESGTTLAAFKANCPRDYDALISRVEKTAFRDVIARFHTVRKAQVVPVLFTHGAIAGRTCSELVLQEGARSFLKSHDQLLDYMAVAAWVRFTENYSSSPKLFLKLSGESPKRTSLKSWQESLFILQGGQCFYCETKTEASSSEVDHVLPWSYVLEDRTWNLVLSCSKCNSSKSDRLPADTFLDKLLHRNAQILSGTVTLKNGKFNRDFEEWHSRDLISHIRTKYDEAKGELFPIWYAARSSAASRVRGNC